MTHKVLLTLLKNQLDYMKKYYPQLYHSNEDKIRKLVKANLNKMNVPHEGKQRIVRKLERL